MRANDTPRAPSWRRRRCPQCHDVYTDDAMHRARYGTRQTAWRERACPGCELVGPVAYFPEVITGNFPPENEVRMAAGKAYRRWCDAMESHADADDTGDEARISVAAAEFAIAEARLRYLVSLLPHTGEVG